RFTDAYTNSPICVPARAALATGRHVHQIRFWDNAIPYDGSVPSWHHRLRDAGHEATAIGKLHFRSADDDNGFTEEVMPLHVVDGIGDPLRWLREPVPVRVAGPGGAGGGSRCRSGRRRCGSPARPGPAIPTTRITTRRSPRRRSIG